MFCTHCRLLDGASSSSSRRHQPSSASTSRWRLWGRWRRRAAVAFYFSCCCVHRRPPPFLLLVLQFACLFSGLIFVPTASDCCRQPNFLFFILIWFGPNCRLLLIDSGSSSSAAAAAAAAALHLLCCSLSRVFPNPKLLLCIVLNRHHAFQISPSHLLYLFSTLRTIQRSFS